MKTRNFFNKIIPLVALLSVLGMASCSKGPTAKKDSNIDYWTCTMHPSVHSKNPGKCPICSMDLVAVLKKTSNALPSESSPPSGGSMEGMAGMPGMQGSGQKTGAQSHEFVVP